MDGSRYPRSQFLCERSVSPVSRVCGGYGGLFGQQQPVTSTMSRSRLFGQDHNARDSNYRQDPVKSSTYLAFRLISQTGPFVGEPTQDDNNKFSLRGHDVVRNSTVITSSTRKQFCVDESLLSGIRGNFGNCRESSTYCGLDKHPVGRSSILEIDRTNQRSSFMDRQNDRSPSPVPVNYQQSWTEVKSSRPNLEIGRSSSTQRWLYGPSSVSVLTKHTRLYFTKYSNRIE